LLAMSERSVVLDRFESTILHDAGACAESATG
jgi:hypothetical protein